MITALSYRRPDHLADALAWLTREPGAQPLAGGQSLLAAAKLGLAYPSHVIDLQRITELKDIRIDPDAVWIGAMATHARVASHPELAVVCPMLGALAGGIADQQVRNRGTIGGSIALHDPSACWPAGLLATGATVVTDRRAIIADDFFRGLFDTALDPGELIVGVQIPRRWRGVYLKSEQKASRFALVGVAVARFEADVGVAITGLGHGVVRWAAAEAALAVSFDPGSLLSVSLDLPATGDLHASAEYRAHLARVLTVRAVARVSGLTAPRVPHLAASSAPAGELLQGAVTRPGSMAREQSPDLLARVKARLTAAIDRYFRF